MKLMVVVLRVFWGRRWCVLSALGCSSLDLVFPIGAPTSLLATTSQGRCHHQLVVVCALLLHFPLSKYPHLVEMLSPVALFELMALLRHSFSHLPWAMTTLSMENGVFFSCMTHELEMVHLLLEDSSWSSCLSFQRCFCWGPLGTSLLGVFPWLSSDILYCHRQPPSFASAAYYAVIT